MQMCIVGTGAVGGLMGAKLSAAGHDVGAAAATVRARSRSAVGPAGTLTSLCGAPAPSDTATPTASRQHVVDTDI